MTLFDKPALDLPAQLKQWKGRGLVVADELRAQRYLAVVGYYRLSAYSLPFQLGNPEHHFIIGTSFDDILDLYAFDRELRLLVLDAIERIEVSMRSGIGNYMATKYGAHWYLNESHFAYSYDHKALLADIELHCKRKKELFVKHYAAKYSSPRLPPSWVVMELLTFGQLSMIYDRMANVSDQKAIARLFGTQAELLRSWLQTLSYIRNVCAHHSRLWNRELGNAPKVPKKSPSSWIKWPIEVSDDNIRPHVRLYLVLVVIEFLLQSINPESLWHQRLCGLMHKYNRVSKAHMGMPEEWSTDSFWRLSEEQEKTLVRPLGFPVV